MAASPAAHDAELVEREVGALDALLAAAAGRGGSRRADRGPGGDRQEQAAAMTLAARSSELEREFPCRKLGIRSRRELGAALAAA